MSYSVLNEQKIASNDFLRYVKSYVSEMDSVRIVGRIMLLCLVTMLNVGQIAFPVHVRTVVYMSLIFVDAELTSTQLHMLNWVLDAYDWGLNTVNVNIEITVFV